MVNQMTNHSKKRQVIFLCAGGTGGHMFPALALAQDLQERGFKPMVLTDKRGMAYIDENGPEAISIPSSSLSGNLFKKMAGALQLIRGYNKARRLIGKHRPPLAIGFGGYPSLPSMLAAQHKKIATVIHEQNAVIGKANAFLASKADRIAVSLPNMTGLDEVDNVRAVLTGNPVRPEISQLYSKAYHALQNEGVFRILVMGGSQGASIFGQVVPEALAALSEEQKSRLHVVQQCLESDQDQVKQAYSDAGIKCDLRRFIDDVADQLQEAHLFIGRSGATTVAEIATAGRPAIFVPYPHHKDRQQEINAESVAEQGGAWVMVENGFTPEALRTKIETFYHNPQSLFEASEAARGCARPDASRKLGNLITALASGWDHKPNDKGE